MRWLDRADGQSVTFGYDDAGRLSSVTQPRGVSGLTYHVSGSGAGRMWTLGSPDGVGLSFGYDGALPTSETWSFEGSVSSSVGPTYEANLWPTQQVVAGTRGAVTYGYDLDGLVTSATPPGGATLKLSPDTTTSVLDSTRVSGLATRLGHNPYAELTSSAAWYGGDSLLTERYDRDNVGRITRIVEATGGTTTDRGYHYDLRGRLVCVRDSLAHTDIVRYRYDPNGNRLGLLSGADSVSAAYDGQDRLVDHGSAHYTYTAAGERLTRTDTAGTMTTSYDLLGNLVKVWIADGDSVEYVVDGKNRRVGRRLNGQLTAHWVYGSDLAVVGELDSAGALTKRFVYASAGHVPQRPPFLPEPRSSRSVPAGIKSAPASAPL